MTFGLEMGRDICIALGLDPNTVSDIKLHVGVTEPAMFTIERWVSGEEAEAIVSVIERYGITLIEEEADA